MLTVMSPVRGESGRAAPAAARISPEEIVDALMAVMGELKSHLQTVVQPFGLPMPSAMALRMIDGAISMKELGARMHCDGSFITSIADELEERDLARREIDQKDRRIKNLVLTPKGLELRLRLQRDVYEDFSGVRALDDGEQRTLLELLRKMAATQESVPAGAATTEPATAVS
jgi:DNA-binding MarR family transcriptional regulator